MSALRLVVVIGTRPEAIKLMPVVVAALARPADFEVRIARTGQHRELVDDVMREFAMEAHVNLDCMRHDQGPAHVMSESVRGLANLFVAEQPHWVIVQGDTTTTLAGALAGFYEGIPVAHVEAGLRTHDRHSPFPEEMNRRLTSGLATLHFAPTPQARANLLREGVAERDIVVTGNTVVDALRLVVGEPHDPRASGRESVLVTVHRRENHGPALERICDGILRLVERRPNATVDLPMHPSPRVRAVVVERLGGHPRIRLGEPLGYRAFVEALDRATLVLTDSGGVQEECAALGRPVLILRDETERREVIDEGVALLVGTDAEAITRTAEALFDDPERYARMARRTPVFGDGYAAQTIVDTLVNYRSALPRHVLCARNDAARLES